MRYRAQSQHGPSLQASILENGASGRLRLREGRAPIKVTQHSSGKDRTRARVSLLCYGGTVPGTQGRPSPSLPHPLYSCPPGLPQPDCPPCVPTAGSQPDPALLLFSWTSRLQGTKGKRGSSSAASTQGAQAQDGEPSSLGRHQQAGLHPRASCSPRAMRRAEEDTHLGPGLAAPSLSLPEPHLTPRLPLRSLGNLNAPMTPRSVLAGSLLLQRP